MLLSPIYFSVTVMFTVNNQVITKKGYHFYLFIAIVSIR